MKFQPLGDRVLLLPTKAPERTPGGILLPDRAQTTPQEGTIVSVGPGRTLEDGTVRKMNVQVGDVAAYSKYGGTEIELEGETFMILEENQLFGVWRDEEETVNEQTLDELIAERTGGKSIRDFVKESVPTPIERTPEQMITHLQQHQPVESPPTIDEMRIWKEEGAGSGIS